MIDKYKINRIVEYIKQSEFEFELDEVIHDTERILAYYDIVDIELSEDEYILLMLELLPLAEAFEFREAAYIGLQEDSLISQIPERKFSLKQEAVERKLTRVQSHTQVLDFLHRLAVA